MSTHSVNIIEIEKILPHDNADSLELIMVGGWQCVSRKGTFKIGDRAIYIEPDYVVKTDRPEFSFLAKKGKDTHRLKSVRLRGARSFGLLLPVPENLKDRQVGDNVMEELEIVRYEPPIRNQNMGTNADRLSSKEWPPIHNTKFDLENIQNFPNIIKEGELVVFTEKLDGANCRYLNWEGKFYVGSRNQWLKPESEHLWSKVCTEEMKAWCAENEGTILYGEVYGPVQSLKYGMKEPRFAAFAASNKDGNWWNQEVLFNSLNSFKIETAPIIYSGPFETKKLYEMAEEDSVVGPKGHMKEGIVVVPYKERYHSDIGRVALKYISNRYWES